MRDESAAIVLARMSSSRLPGKALRLLGPQPVLQYTLDRLLRVSPPVKVVVATSDLASDDPLESFCAVQGVHCHRGPLEDVALRAVQAAEEVGAAWFFRVNGDSPFVPVDLFPLALALVDGRVDIISNVHPRSLCPGLSVELVRTEALRALLPSLSCDEREHVTACFYGRAELANRVARCPVPDVQMPRGARLVVDDAADLALATAVVHAMVRPQWTYPVAELLEVLRRQQARTA